MTPIDWIALAVLAFSFLSGLDVLLGTRRLVRASRLPDWEGGEHPSVSIVVAARNEARGVERAMRSLLTLAWPALEVVAVDDRSEDGTGEILDRLAREDARLAVVHVGGLPGGWLGKNYALHVGSERARGDWILFADADVVMRPNLLGRVLRYAIEQRFDHIALAPEFHMPGLILETFNVGFVLSFYAFMRPWKAKDPRSRRFIGIGAFNLVRAAAYERAGGHAKIRLRPDDDIKLGKILKASGARQDLVAGKGLASVEWYHSLSGLIHGLEKNAFAGLEYRVAVVIPAVLLHLAVGLGPLLGLALAGGPARLFCAGAVAWALFLYATAARETGSRLGTALLYPVFVLLFNWIVVRTMVVNLANGGIRWRGTFYPLAELRRNRV